MPPTARLSILVCAQRRVSASRLTAVATPSAGMWRRSTPRTGKLSESQAEIQRRLYHKPTDRQLKASHVDELDRLRDVYHKLLGLQFASQFSSGNGVYFLLPTMNSIC